MMHDPEPTPDPMADVFIQDVPANYRDGVTNYLAHHLQPGDFLEAVFKDSLCDAAEADQSANLTWWAMWLERCVPGEAYGSPERYHRWLNPPADPPQDRG